MDQSFADGQRSQCITAAIDHIDDVIHRFKMHKVCSSYFNRSPSREILGRRVEILVSLTQQLEGRSYRRRPQRRSVYTSPYPYLVNNHSAKPDRYQAKQQSQIIMVSKNSSYLYKNKLIFLIQ